MDCESPKTHEENCQFLETAGIVALAGGQAELRIPIGFGSLGKWGIHESAHCVIGRALGWRPAFVTVMGSGDTGRWAGFVAFGSADTEPSAPSADNPTDEHTAFVNAYLLAPSRGLTTEALIAFWRERADNLLTQHWDAVERVAGLLRERGELNSGELEELLSGV